jgi:hypothetical protein
MTHSLLDVAHPTTGAALAALAFFNKACVYPLGVFAVLTLSVLL